MPDYLLASEQAREAAVNAVRSAPEGYVVSVHPAKRTVAANRFYRAMLKDISEQKRMQGRLWPVNAWHEYYKYLLIPPGIIELPDGRMKEQEPSTRNMNRAEFSYYVENVMADAAGEGVKFSADTRDEYLMFEASKRRR